MTVRRADESPDREFYALPRFVVHIGDAAIEAVRTLYASLALGPHVLDLMSSWRSHLPARMRAVGLGMNADEMRDNPALSSAVVADLNATPALPFAPGAFDDVVCCVSVQYLVRPVEVFRDVARCLRPGGRFVITFSNRCFPTKAVAPWLATGDAGHVELVRDYFHASRRFEDVRFEDRSPRHGDPLYCVRGVSTP